MDTKLLMDMTISFVPIYYVSPSKGTQIKV